MAWIEIPNTNFEYDTEAYDKLPENRKEWWEFHDHITFSNGIRTDTISNEEFYLNVRPKNKYDEDPEFTENELNKTYLDLLNGE